MTVPFGFLLLLGLALAFALYLFLVRWVFWRSYPRRQRNVVAIGEPVESDRPPRWDGRGAWKL